MVVEVVRLSNVAGVSVDVRPTGGGGGGGREEGGGWDGRVRARSKVVKTQRKDKSQRRENGVSRRSWEEEKRRDKGGGGEGEKKERNKRLLGSFQSLSDEDWRGRGGGGRKNERAKRTVEARRHSERDAHQRDNLERRHWRHWRPGDTWTHEVEGTSNGGAVSTTGQG